MHDGFGGRGSKKGQQQCGTSSASHPTKTLVRLWRAYWHVISPLNGNVRQKRQEPPLPQLRLLLRCHIRFPSRDWPCYRFALVEQWHVSRTKVAPSIRQR